MAKNSKYQKKLNSVFKHIISYMYANFQLPKLIFEEEDRFFLRKLCTKLAIFWPILTKIDNFEGIKNPEKSKFQTLLPIIF